MCHSVQIRPGRFFRSNNLKYSFFLLTLIVVQHSWSVGPSSQVESAQEVRFKEIPFEMKENEKLVISSLHGRVILKGQEGTGSSSAVYLRAKKIRKKESTQKDGPSSSGTSLGDKQNLDQEFADLSFTVRKEGNAYLIEDKGIMSRSDLARKVEEREMEMVYEIEASSQPVEIHLHDGAVSVKNWHRSVDITLVDGTVQARDSSGDFNVQLQKGVVTVESHIGRVDIDSFGAQFSAKKVEGDLIVKNFGGESNFNEIKGDVDIRTYSGPVQVAKLSGSLAFDVGRSVLKIIDLEGALRGKTDLGTVSAGLLGESEVDVESNQGTVGLRLPASSGAALKLNSEEGAIYAPEGVKSYDSGNGQAVRTRLKGDGPKGVVTIKSKSGIIRVH